MALKTKRNIFLENSAFCLKIQEVHIKIQLNLKKYNYQTVVKPSISAEKLKVARFCKQFFFNSFFYNILFKIFINLNN